MIDNERPTKHIGVCWTRMMRHRQYLYKPLVICHVVSLTKKKNHMQISLFVLIKYSLYFTTISSIWNEHTYVCKMKTNARILMCKIRYDQKYISTQLVSCQKWSQLTVWPFFLTRCNYAQT